MKILSPEQFKQEEPELYENSKEAINRFKVNRIFYIEDKYDLMSYDYLETEDTKLKVSSSLIYSLPMKKYFTLVLTAKSRSNVNEPYYFYKIQTMNQLITEILKEKGEIVFEDGNDLEEQYEKQSKQEEIDKDEFIEELDNEENERLKTLMEDLDTDEFYEEGDDE